MDITYDSRTRVFRLDTGNMTYAMGVVDDEGFLGHLYLGPGVGNDDLTYLSRAIEYPGLPSKNNRDRCSFLDFFPHEYPGEGVGDFRSPAVRVTKDGISPGIQPLYKGYRIIKGKKRLEGMPSVFGDEKDSETLEIEMSDETAGVKLFLDYTIFEGINAVVRSVRAQNTGDTPVTLNRIMSFSADMDRPGETRLMTLNGSWGRERAKQIIPVGTGFAGVSSVRGVSSHQSHPFLGLLSEGADESQGEVIGLNFIYSGNFLAQVEKGQFGTLRVQMGIHPMGFYEKLQPGESFQSPEAVLVWSDSGIGGMTRTFHELYRNHLIRSPWLHRERPVLINNWEATFFDFDLEKLLKIARRASSEGAELLVMDDGWFGRRNSDNSSLGDWYVNEEKLPGGVKRLSEELAAIGMKLGIWFEPEMVSPDSDLYRAHPDWAFSIDGRKPCMAREQYVLDLTRKEVRDYIFDMISKVLDSADVAYVKWDMNRPLTDVGTHAADAGDGGLFHRFVLGVYDLQERLITRYPDLLLENCSSGGGRFDPGMLFYSPQIWTSDNTDAIDRLSIQEGTAMIYPLSTMGAHVSVSPSQSCGRKTPMVTRGHVALAGTFGYELDMDRLPGEDSAQIRDQIALYHRYGELVREGDYYRIESWQDGSMCDCYMVVSKDKTQALMTWVQVLAHTNLKSRRVRIPGLDPDREYRIEVADPREGNDGNGNRVSPNELNCMSGFLGKTLTGATLSGAGILMPRLSGDFRSLLISFDSRG
ncbi:MAG: alpha-galactosidase [Lachnospiraceae bacterium]|nr:alpha-galactosidase [Lachnospiraceae bacterium]